jgi:molecular chaperone GrpE
LLNAFTKHKIEKVTPAMGEKFDPNRHQAMFEAPIPGAEPGTVIEVMQAGFNIADRLLRPALVGVARAAPQPAAAESEPEETGSGENGAE